MEQFKKIGTMVASILVTVSSAFLCIKNLIDFFRTLGLMFDYGFGEMFGTVLTLLVTVCFFLGTAIFGALKCVKIFIDKK